MQRIARYFVFGIILVFILVCLFVSRLHLAEDTLLTAGGRPIRWQGSIRVPDAIPERSRTNTTTAKLTSSKCRESWREGNDTEWFCRNFDPSLSPIWTRENVFIPSKVFDWWNNLFHGKQQPYIKVINLVKHLALNPDLFLGNRPRDSITCAVVGNSGNVRKSGYGRMIDDHDIIIRMNGCQTVGYEEDVGSRTTHYFAYPQSFKKYSLNNSSFVLAAFCYADMEWLYLQLSKQNERSDDEGNGMNVAIEFTHNNQTGNTVPFDKNKIFIVNPELMWQIKHKWGLGRGRYSSTGVISVFFALQICDKVDVYGFGATSKGNWDHYFAKDDGEANSIFKVTHVHDSEAENSLLQKLLEEKRITIFRGIRSGL